MTTQYKLEGPNDTLQTTIRIRRRKETRKKKERPSEFLEEEQGNQTLKRYCTYPDIKEYDPLMTQESWTPQ